ncbi:hypothetical protein GDO81_030079 [Engystomops pustulosus]|uniref:Uncharacterized protein n=1 Tax=Engystomops pustulosus TaxID=76066 RepID=A0AAV6ZKD8_ENGPU|nr:hypothetical protein GDO81_030079 [Engystomops pustulosus]
MAVSVDATHPTHDLHLSYASLYSLYTVPEEMSHIKSSLHSNIPKSSLPECSRMLKTSQPDLICIQALNELTCWVHERERCFCSWSSLWSNLAIDVRRLPREQLGQCCIP